MLEEWAIPLKLLYFFVNFQYYSFYNYRPNFAEARGMTKAVFGHLFGFVLLLCFFTNSFLATINDKFERTKLLICALLITSCISFELFYIIPDGMFFFWIVMLFYSLCSTALPALLDKFAIEYLAKENHLNPATYGNQRLFGSLGYLFSNFVVEAIVRPPDEEFNFAKLAFLVPIVTIPAVLITMYIVKNYESSHSRSDIETGFVSLLRNREYMFFIFIIFLNGLSRSGMTLFLTLYHDKVLLLSPYKLSGGGSSLKKAVVYVFELFNKRPMSTVAFCAVVIEIFIMFQSRRIISFMGLYWPLLFAQMAQFIRFVGYYALPYDSEHVFAYSCLLETMKGVNFGLTHSSAVHIANKLCPAYLKTTSQMIYTGTFQALGSFFAGQLFGGIFSKSTGGTTPEEKSKEFDLFFITNMGITIICIVLFVVKYGFYDRTLTFRRTERDSIAVAKKETHEQPKQERTVSIKDEKQKM